MGDFVTKLLLSLLLVAVVALAVIIRFENRRRATTISAASVEASAPSQPERPVAPTVNDPRNWSVYSANGHSMLTQACTGAKECVLRCVRDGAKAAAWSLSETPVAERDDYRFVSDDCAHAWILYPLPPSLGGLALAPAALFLTEGKITYSIPLPGFVHQLGKLRTLTAHVEWLQGDLGVSGVPPRYSDDGRAIELGTVDGLLHRLPFELQAPPGELKVAETYARAALATKSGAISGSGDLIKWTDDDGEVHFTQNPSEVPARYIHRAARTAGGDVSVIEGAHYPAPAPGSLPSSEEREAKFAEAMRAREAARMEAERKLHPVQKPKDDTHSWGNGSETFSQYCARIATMAAVRRMLR